MTLLSVNYVYVKQTVLKKKNTEHYFLNDLIIYEDLQFLRENHAFFILKYQKIPKIFLSFIERVD